MEGEKPLLTLLGRFNKEFIVLLFDSFSVFYRQCFHAKFLLDRLTFLVILLRPNS